MRMVGAIFFTIWSKIVAPLVYLVLGILLGAALKYETEAATAFALPRTNRARGSGTTRPRPESHEL